MNKTLHLYQTWSILLSLHLHSRLQDFCWAFHQTGSCHSKIWHYTRNTQKLISRNEVGNYINVNIFRNIKKTGLGGGGTILFLCQRSLGEEKRWCEEPDTGHRESRKKVLNLITFMTLKVRTYLKDLTTHSNLKPIKTWKITSHLGCVHPGLPPLSHISTSSINIPSKFQRSTKRKPHLDLKSVNKMSQQPAPNGINPICI